MMSPVSRLETTYVANVVTVFLSYCKKLSSWRMQAYRIWLHVVCRKLTSVSQKFTAYNFRISINVSKEHTLFSSRKWR